MQSDRHCIRLPRLCAKKNSVCLAPCPEAHARQAAPRLWGRHAWWGMASQTLSARLWLDVCRAQMVFAQSVQAHLAAAGADRTTEAREAVGA